MKRGRVGAPPPIDGGWPGSNDAESWAVPSTTPWSVEGLYPTTAPPQRWHQRRGIQLAAAAVGGMLIGALLGGGNSDELRGQLAQEQQSTRTAVEERARAQSERDQAVQDAASARAEASEASGVAAAARAQEDEFEQQAAQLSTQAAELAAREAALTAREAQLAAAERSASSSPGLVSGGTSSGGAATGPYPNCSAARAAGDTPVYAGEAGYGSHLDRDGDGIGCE